MARIDSYTSGGRLDQVPTGGQADPSAYARPASALLGVGESVQGGGAVVAQIGAKRENDKAITWATKTTYEIKDKLAEFELANDKSETFGEDLKTFGDKLHADAALQAPSAHARKLLQGPVLSSIHERYAMALKQGERNRLENAVTGAQDNVGLLMQTLRKDAARGSVATATDLFESDYYNLLDSQDAIFGKDTKLAQKTKEMITSQAVSGMADLDPAYAKQLLDESPHVDENTRYALENRIEASGQAQRAMAAATLHLKLENEFKAHGAAKTTMPMPSDADLRLAYGQGWQAQKITIGADVDGHNRAVGIYAGLKDKNGNFQKAAVAAMGRKLDAQTKANAVDPIDQKAYGAIKAWVSESVDLQASDAVAWQRQHQDDVATAWRMADESEKSAAEMESKIPSGATVPDAVKVARAEANLKAQSAITLSMSLQGHGDDRHIGLEDVNTHALTRVQATELAKRLVDVGPNERVGLVNAWQQKYGPDVFPHVFHDLITMPPEGKRVPQEIELGLWLEHAPGVQAAYMQAQISDKELKALTPERSKDFTLALQGDDTWKALLSPSIGEYGQRVQAFSGYQNGIINYANYLELQKFASSPAAAVKLAVANTLGSTIGFTSPINGVKLVIPKWTRPDASGGSTQRTQLEINDLGRRANIMLWQVPVADVRLTDDLKRSFFPNLPTTSETGKRDYLHKIIGEGGFWVLGKDGQDATLYLRNDGGERQQLLDDKGRPWRIKWDGLESFMAGSIKSDYRFGEAPDMVRVGAAAAIPPSFFSTPRQVPGDRRMVPTEETRRNAEQALAEAEQKRLFPTREPKPKNPFPYGGIEGTDYGYKGSPLPAEWTVVGDLWKYNWIESGNFENLK